LIKGALGLAIALKTDILNVGRVEKMNENNIQLKFGGATGVYPVSIA
jgi:hypothetical protein